MIAVIPALSLLFVLASQAAAFTFNVTLGTQTLFASQLLPPLSGSLAQVCSGQCDTANTTLSNCNDDATCLCSNDTVASLLTCEQCMYQELIAENKPLPDPRAGSTPVLAGYSASCALFNVTLTKPQTALTIPTNWDGPEGLFVSPVGLVFTVGTGVFLSVSSLMILSNM